MGFFILILLILFCAGVAAANLLYWYECGNNPDQDIPAPALGPRSFLTLWALSVRGLVMAVLVRPLGLFYRLRDGSGTDGLPDQKNPPLLLVHGLYHDNSAWVLFKRHLLKAGFRRIHMLHYATAGTKLEELPAKLDHAVSELERLYPGEKPLLMGHSLGGLIIRSWLALEGNQARASGVLTLGAPQRGSKVAAFAIGGLGKSLLPTNPFFARLAETEPPASIPCVALVTPGDTMVLPLRNLVPVTPNWELRLTPLESHIGLLFSPAVQRMAAWELHRMSAAATPSGTGA